MYGATTLAITGYRNEPVPHRFLRQDEHARHVAILLPGIGYTCDMPLLYYPARLLLARGADVLRVEYAYQQREDFTATTAEEQGRWVVADVTAACHAVLAQRDYEQITFVAGGHIEFEPEWDPSEFNPSAGLFRARRPCSTDACSATGRGR